VSRGRVDSSFDLLFNCDDLAYDEFSGFLTSFWGLQGNADPARDADRKYEYRCLISQGQSCFL
jgi:hypothetical protein